jgi:hypothetical protein
VQLHVEGGGGWILIEHAGSKSEVRKPRDLCQHLDGSKRISAKVEEVVIGLDV